MEFFPLDPGQLQGRGVGGKAWPDWAGRWGGAGQGPPGEGAGPRPRCQRGLGRGSPGSQSREEAAAGGCRRPGAEDGGAGGRKGRGRGRLRERMENLGLGLEDTGSPRRWSRGAVSLRNRRGGWDLGRTPGSPKGGGSQPGPGFLGSDLDGREVVAVVVRRGEGSELGVRTPQSLMEGAGGLDSGFPGLQKLGEPLRF